MEVYLFTLLSVAIFANLAERHPVKVSALGKKNGVNKASIYVFIVAAILIFVAGCRWGVGEDFWAYRHSFDRRADEWWDKLWVWEEPGLGFIGAVSRFIYNDPKTLIFNASLVTVGLYVKSIYKNSFSANCFTFAIVLYILTGCWHNSFNGIRQYLAAAVLFAGSSYAMEGKVLKWIIVVLFASLFHRTAIIMLPVFLISKGRLNKKKVVLIAIGSITLALFGDMIFSIMGELKGQEQQTTEYAQTEVNIFRVLAAAAPIALATQMKREFWDDPFNSFTVGMVILNAGLMFATMNSAYLARVGIYTEMYTCIAIPRMIRSMKKRNRIAWTIIVLGAYLYFCYHEISVRDSLNTWDWAFLY